MDKGLAVFLMAVVGGLIALQAPINAGLGKETGQLRRGARLLRESAPSPWPRSSIAQRQGRRGPEAANVDWYYLLGGLLGAAYVFSALVLVDEIGAGGVAAATVTGQLTASVVLDRLGVLGLEQTPITWEPAARGRAAARRAPTWSSASRLALDPKRRLGLEEAAEVRHLRLEAGRDPARQPVERLDRRP